MGVSANGTNEVRVYNIGNLNLEQTFADFEAQGSIRYLQFSPDGAHLACGHSSSTIYMFNMRDGSTNTLNGHSTQVTCIKFLRDTEGQFVAGSGSGELFLWDYLEGNVIRRLSGHGQQVNGICITQRDEEVFSSGTDGKTIYQKLSGGVLHTFTEARNHNCCGVTADDRFLLVGTDNSRIVIWNTETKERLVALIEHGRGVKDICLSSDDRYFVSCGGDQTIFLMGLTEKKMRGRMKGHENQIYGIDISPDNRFLASAGMDCVCRIWDTKTMKQVRVLDDHSDTINGVSFSPDGKMLVTGSMDSNVMLYNTEDWGVRKRIKGRGWKTVYSAIINNAGTQVLFGADAVVRVFDIDNEEEIA